MQIDWSAMKKRFYVILFFVLLIGYILFSPQQLKKELLILPSWISGIEESTFGGNSGDSLPFRLDSVLGYFSSDGRILYSENISDRAAVSDDFFVNYSTVSRNLVLQDVNGEIIGSIHTEGLPFFIGKRFFTVSPGIKGIATFSF